MLHVIAQTQPDSIGFIVSVLNHPVIFVLLVTALIMLLGSQGGSIVPGIACGFTWLGYIMLQLDNELIRYGIYLTMFGVTLYIALTISSLQMSDSGISGGG